MRRGRQKPKRKSQRRNPSRSKTQRGDADGVAPFAIVDNYRSLLRRGGGRNIVFIVLVILVTTIEVVIILIVGILGVVCPFLEVFDRFNVLFAGEILD